MRTRNIGSLAAGFALAGVLTLAPGEAPATAGAQSRPTVAAAVAEMLRDGLDLEGVTVTVAGIEATLAGSVPTLWDKTEAIERTLAFPQVETVASELVVPEVEDDNEIAREVDPNGVARPWLPVHANRDDVRVVILLVLNG